MPLNCKLCHKDFPFIKYINGVKRSGCSRAYCWDCSPYGEKRRRRLTMTRETKECSVCKLTKNLSDYYPRRRGFGPHDVNSSCKSCDFLRQYQSKEENKAEYVKYKGGKCEKCGYNKCNSALDFHHLNPKQKKFSLSKERKSIWSKGIKEELDKCILLCANCHRELHYEKIAIRKEKEIQSKKPNPYDIKSRKEKLKKKIEDDNTMVYDLL